MRSHPLSSGRLPYRMYNFFEIWIIARVPQRLKIPILLAWHIIAVTMAIAYAIDRLLLMRMFLRHRGLWRR